MTHQFKLFAENYSKRKAKKDFKDVFNASMFNVVNFSKVTEIPIMKAEQTIPKDIISITEAKYYKGNDFDKFVHFYVNDYKYEDLFEKADKYLEILSRFKGIISPDFSTSSDFPRAVKYFNTYRNNLFGSWFQQLGYRSICNVRCSFQDIKYELDGVPRNSVLSLGAVGNIKNKNDRENFALGLIRLVDICQPTALLIYGQDSYGVFDYPKSKHIPLYFYEGNLYKRFRSMSNDKG